MIAVAASHAVAGILNSYPNRTFTLRLFVNAAHSNEGQRFVGQTTVTTDGAGDAVFAFAPASLLPVGSSVTVTATRDDGNSSEFSDSKQVATSRATPRQA